MKGNTVRPKKSLSQSFLIDQKVVARLVKAGKIAEKEWIVEIGPGKGVITKEMVRRGATVVAIERDPDVSLPLFSTSSPQGVLIWYWADALCVDFRSIYSSQQAATGKGKMIANLPFHISAPLLQRLLPLHSYYTSYTFILQEEIARRITAPLATRQRGSLTLFCQFYSQVRYLFPISASSFWPQPKVNAAAVQFTLHRPPLKDQSEIDLFFVLIRRAFSQKRKMVRSSLRSLFSSDKITGALFEAGLPETCRPEEIALNDFIRFFSAIHGKKRDE